MPRAGRAAVWAGACALLAGCHSSSPNLLTAEGAITSTADDLRTGWYPNQPALSPAVVGGPTFGRLWRTTLPLAPGEQVFAQPLVSRGTVFVVTEANDIYSLDAETGAILASRALGSPWQAADIGCGDLTPTVGITGTPVIDDATSTAYFLSKTYLTTPAGTDPSNTAWFAHAVDVATLAERPGFPLRVQGTAANDPTVTFQAFYQAQRPGLLLMGGIVYVAFGAHCDRGPYAGWVVGIDPAGAQITSLFTTETGALRAGGSAIWHAGGGLASDAAGRIFFATSNHLGREDETASAVPTAVLNESVVRLEVRPDRRLVAADFFAPFDRTMLDMLDMDIGSGGPVALPSSFFGTTGHPDLMVAGGKPGTLYLLDRDNLGGFKQGPSGGNAVLGAITIPGTGMWSRPAVWPGDGGWLYVVAANSGLDALRYGVDGTGTPVLTVAGAGTDLLGFGSGSPIVTSDGTASGSALVWINYASGPYGGGQLRAYDALPDSAGRLRLRYEDAYGVQAKFSVPGVGDGRLYVGTADGAVLGYGAPQTASLSAPAVDFGSQIVGTTSTATATLTANRDLVVTALAASAPVFSLAASAPALPVTLPRGGTLSVPVTFTPAAAHGYVASLDVTTSQGPATASLRGVGLAVGPALSVTPQALSFGGLARGTSATLGAILSNVGTQPMTWSAFTLPPAPFSVTGLPAVGDHLAPGASITVTVVFAPTVNGNFTGMLTLGSDGGSFVLGLAGAAADPPVLSVDTGGADPMVFHAMAGQTDARAFTISNTGASPLTITKSKPPALGAFTAATNLDEGTRIAPGQTLTQSVVFAPPTTGTFTDAWTITGDDGSGVHSVRLQGTADPPGNGLLATYFDQRNLTGRSITRVDPNVDFNWGLGSPDPRLPSDEFSVRWTGAVTPAFSETYTFHTTSDDGVRLWIDGQQLVNDWTDHGRTEDRGAIALVGGRSYDLRLEFYDRLGGASIRLEWSGASQPRQVVPQERLRTSAAAPPLDGGAIADAVAPSETGGASAPPVQGLAAEYFSNRTLTGTAVTRIDPTVNFKWGLGSPDPAIPVDGFSARWTGFATPTASETFTFYTVSDDGVRLWVNGQPLVDNWTDHGATEDSGTLPLIAGQSYAIEMDFYENAGGATATLSWSSPSTAKQIIPTRQLSTAAVAPPPGRPDAGGPDTSDAASDAPSDAVSPPLTGGGTGLLGTYFDAINLVGHSVARVDPIVLFNWGLASPDPAIPVDRFSVRWTGWVQAPVTDTFTFHTFSDDGVRLTIAGQALVSNWTDHGRIENTGSIALVAGQLYPVVMDYYDDLGGANVELDWSTTSMMRQPVPQNLLYPTLP